MVLKVQINRLPELAAVNSVRCRHARHDVYTPNQVSIPTDIIIGTAHDERGNESPATVFSRWLPKGRGFCVPQSWAKTTIFTIGHSTRPLAEFVTLLHEVRIDLLVDVRSIPRSRTNPQFNTDVLPDSLAAAGIDYRHLPALGGLRHRRKDAAPSQNMLWQNKAFRNYADYAATDAFRAGLDELRVLARDHRCAIMCAEAVWWRCHRRIIADYLLAGGIPVAHIMGHDKVSPATLTPGARPQPDGTLVYPAEEELENATRAPP